MQYVWYYIIIINAAAFLLMHLDKQKAQKGRWRISERTLLLTAALGGSLGAALGMYIFHHKTRKPKFYLTLPALCVLHFALLGYLYLR